MIKVLVATLRDLDDKLEKKYPGINNALQNMGYDVWYTGIRNNVIYLCNTKNMIEVGRITCAKIPVLGRVYKYQNFYNSLIKIIDLGYRFDYCYFRSTIQIGAYGKALAKLKHSGLKVIVEVPTHPCKKEYKSDKRIWRKPIYKIMEYNEEHNAEYVDLYALMGEKDSKYLGRPAINIENGVDIEETRIRNSSSDTDSIHIIAVAKMARWHGYDRVIEGLHIYNDKGKAEKVIFHLVGPDGDGTLDEYKSLVDKYNLHENVVLEGSMFGEELANLFDRCDVAIACLGVHRKNMKTISELKVREYMARGIPFIYSTHDYAINPEWVYCMKVSEDEQPLDIFSVVEFAKSMKNVQGLAEQIRKDCIENMTWEGQMKLLFEYFENIDSRK
ncbi:MAG: glycosyltransferase [Eubacteriales bacterium]|nr:glycosyltransferase [Eubacteriales bacterium]